MGLVARYLEVLISYAAKPVFGNCFEMWVLRVWLQRQLAQAAPHTPRTETATMGGWENHPSHRPFWLRTKESAGNEAMSWTTEP